MFARVALCLVIAVIVLSPLVYCATGIGQQAHALGRDPIVLSDGTLQSSPKAEALHSLTLPLLVEYLLIYPLLLLLLQYSGVAVRFRAGLTARWIPLLQRAPGFRPLDRVLTRIMRQRLSLTDVTTIALYVGLLTLGIGLIGLPVSFYQGFVLQHQFGLSTQTLDAWLRDAALGLGLGLAMMLVLFVGFYSLLKLVPHGWPLLGGAAVTVLAFGYVLLEPVLITPLFYQVTPVTDPDLRGRIDTMAGRAGMTVYEVFIVDASSKTTAGDAYFTGFGDASQIVLWDTLLAYSPDEVDVIIAHEMGHCVYRHVLLEMLLACAGGWAFLFVLRFWLHRVWRGLEWTGPDDVASYPYLLGVMALVGLLALPVVTGISRYAEDQADDFALAVSQKPAAMVQALKRLATDNLAVLDVTPWEEVIFYSHPPLKARIEKAERACASQ